MNRLTYVLTYAGENSITGHLMRFNYNENIRWKTSTVNVEIWIFLSQITAIAVNFLPVWVCLMTTQEPPQKFTDKCSSMATWSTVSES